MHLIDSGGRSKYFNREMVNRHFHKDSTKGDLSFTAATAAEARVIALSSSGFSTGDQIHIMETTAKKMETIHADIVSQTSRNYTINHPLETSYSTNAIARGIEIDIASSSGTITAPVEYKAEPPPWEIWVIDRILIAGTDATQPDDGNFCGMAALTNGLCLELHASTGGRVMTNWRTGGDMAEDMYDVDYRQRSGAGSWGTRGRWTFSKSGTSIVLRGHLCNPGSTTSEYLELYNQDNMKTLTSLEVRAQGRLFHETTGG